MNQFERLLIWGCGELGSRVGQYFNISVIGYTKSEQRHQNLAELSIEPRIGSAAADLKPTDALLIALPGHRNQLPALAELASVAPPKRAVLISSTGYYGGATGHVDEQTPAGSSERAQAIASAERQFLAWSAGNGVVLRCGGLYMDGRGPMSAFARKRTVPPRPADGTLALIHYADAAQAAVQALTHPNPKAIYLCVTPPCPTRRQFYSLAAKTIGLHSLTFENETVVDQTDYSAYLLREDLLPKSQFPDWRAAVHPV